MRNRRQHRSNLHHFTFSPKYRKPVLADPFIARAVESHIKHICALKGILIKALAIQPDHVHVFCHLPKTMSPAQAAFLIKWFSSIWVRKNFPHLRQQKAFWQVNYFSRTVGVESRIVKKYIQKQEKND